MTSPVPTQQVPGLYRRRFGEAVVTAISDGGMMANPATLQNIELADSQAILEHAGRMPPLMTALNVFVVQTAGQTVLVDTGGGNLMGPTAGHMTVALHAAGIAPGDVDVVLMTHLHIDHVGGLLDANDKPAFPNATLVVPQGEVDYWLDEAQAAAAAEDKKPRFALAKRMTAPYAMRAFDGGEPVPGIEAVPLPGHTPGHTGYAMGPADGRLLIWGDIMHAPDIQCRRPEAAVMFDVDQPQAIATRRAILARAADERLLVAGMHMHFPAFARIVRDGDAYAIRPIAWLPQL
jgi:glyoxylase-like metal-dependent hydrolase (beta-lactamase superfamily II)